MWLLPNDPAELGAHLPEGAHLLPGRYTEEDRGCLLTLLRVTVPKGTRVYTLDEGAADEALRRRARFPDALLLVRIERENAALPERVAALSELAARYLLIQPPSGDEGTAWMEGALKVPLMRWLRQELRRPDHPLSAFGVGRLDVLDAASETADPVRFLQLIERSVEHRMRFAPVGTEASDWERSLRVVTSRVLGRSPTADASDASIALMAHQRLFHIAREIALLAVDTRVPSPEGLILPPRIDRLFESDGTFWNHLTMLCDRRVGMGDGALARVVEGRTVAAGMLATLREHQASRSRDIARTADFTADVVEFLSFDLSEILSRRDRIASWTRAWGDRARAGTIQSVSALGLPTWQVHCVRSVAMAFTHALLRGRRSTEDLRIACEVLGAVGGSGIHRRPVEALQLCASFVSREAMELSTAAATASKSLLKFLEFLQWLEELEGHARGSRIPSLRRGPAELAYAWHSLAGAEGGRLAQHFVGFVDPAVATAGLSRVTLAVAHIAAGELDEALREATAVLSGGDDVVTALERTFAREIIGTVQAIRGDVDGAIEALVMARETYAALDDSHRRRNVDEQIAALRSAG